MSGLTPETMSGLTPVTSERTDPRDKRTDPRDMNRISFKGTVDTLRHWSASLEAMRGMPRKQQALLDAMFEIIANDLVAHRPDREEPRAKKRRPKNYHLLTKPRHEMKISGHRNRPKSTLS